MIKMNLNSKPIFYSIVFLFVFILTYINNYYFYEYVKIRDYQEIRSLGKNIHYKINNCIINNSRDICIHKIEKYLNSTKPYALVKIGNIINYDNTKPRHKNRELVLLPKYLTKLKSTNETLYIAKHSIPNIFYTTVRSITFSIYDITIKIYETSLHDTLDWYISNKIHMRSRHVIVFFILIYFITRLLRLRQIQTEQQINHQNKDIVKLIHNIDKLKENEKELSNMIKELKSNNIDLSTKIEQYDYIINPPIDTLKYIDIIELDPDSIIFKCRIVTEKIIGKLYIQHIGKINYTNLATMIKELKNKNILNKKSLSYANTIKAFGNISAHPDMDNPIIFTKEDARIISNALILLIEELKL